MFRIHLEDKGTEVCGDILTPKELDELLVVTQTLARKYPYTLDDVVSDEAKVGLGLPTQ